MVMKIHSTSKSSTQLFGVLPNGQEVYVYEISNTKGMSLKVMDYGATLVALKKALKNGEVIDVVLGFDSLNDYVNSYSLPSAPYFGTTIGRYAGRIAQARFELNGTEISLQPNNNGNTLHGGVEGFSQKVWQLKQLTTGTNPSITLSYVSADGEESFPGELQVEVTYLLTEENELVIEYKGLSTKDTVVNLTHHSYFNLDGQYASVLDQDLQIKASQFLETEDMIPTGKLLPTTNSSFDFRNSKSCPISIDTTFVLDTKEAQVASLLSKKNNLKMLVFTNQPAVHIYVGGNCFNQIIGKEGARYRSQSGICFETQNFPDAPNHAHFPSAVLKQGEIYFQKTIYQFQSF
jgi:aldose 1-epimerase